MTSWIFFMACMLQVIVWMEIESSDKLLQIEKEKKTVYMNWRIFIGFLRAYSYTYFAELNTAARISVMRKQDRFFANIIWFCAKFKML